jgi:LPS sulfotransferase NodH
LTVFYEDFVDDPEKTITDILEYLDISTEGLTIGDFPLMKTADAHSEEWVDRFRKDLQEGWDKPAW